MGKIDRFLSKNPVCSPHPPQTSSSPNSAATPRRPPPPPSPVPLPQAPATQDQNHHLQQTQAPELTQAQFPHRPSSNSAGSNRDVQRRSVLDGPRGRRQGPEREAHEGDPEALRDLGGEEQGQGVAAVGCGFSGCSWRSSERSVLDVLKEAGADVIALQNVKAEEERRMRLLSELAEGLGMRFVNRRAGRRSMGTATGKSTF